MSSDVVASVDDDDHQRPGANLRQRLRQRRIGRRRVANDDRVRHDAPVAARVADGAAAAALPPALTSISTRSAPSISSISRIDVGVGRRIEIDDLDGAIGVGGD